MRRLYPITVSAAIGFILVLQSSCDKFEDSPYSTDTRQLPTALNAMNAARLAAREPADDDTITFLFMADCQRFYEDLEATVAFANTLPGIDFAVMAGDLTDFGLLQEYTWVHERLSQLDMPLFCVLGNHDMQAEGEVIFSSLYGPPNYTVTYKGCRFIFHDTNGREYGNSGHAPDMAWLQARLADVDGGRCVTLSHVPPTNMDFDPGLITPYAAALAASPGLLASLHAHVHLSSDTVPFDDGVRYITCGSIESRQLMIVRIIGQTLTTEVVVL